MSLIESRLLNNWRFWRALTLVFCSGIIAIGCGGGGGGGGLPESPIPCSQPSDPCYDPEGSTPEDAVVIVPDGAAFPGKINFGGDVDWFTFRAGHGVTYTLQILGFPFEPGLLPEKDLTAGPETSIVAQIISFDGLNQIANTTSTGGGTTMYDIDPAPREQVEGIFYIGDSRITWTALTTNDMYFKIQHPESITGTGHYVMHLASSQNGLTNTGRMQWASRHFTLYSDDGDLLFDSDANGGVAVTSVNWGLDFPGLNPVWGVGFAIGGSIVFFLDQDGVPEEDPQTIAHHLHWGVPDIRIPQNSANFQACPPDPHCIMFDLGENSLEVPTPEVIRTMTGFEWYMDRHITDDFDVLPYPVVVSMPWGDVYSVFESDVFMSESNVVLRDGSRVPESRQAGGPDFTLFYDSSLKSIQIARRTFNSPFLGGLFWADAEWYEGDILTVYAPRPEPLGPRVVIGPSTIPAPKNPPEFLELLTGDVLPGFRNIIRQLSDDEAEALRDAYYETGIYFEVSRWDTGQPVARADLAPLTPGVRSLEIQDVPFPIIFFPRASDGPLRKGSINFASDYAEGGQITVVSNGKILGVLSDFLDEGLEPPECGETQAGQSLTAEYWPHSYPYKAVAEDGTEWKGHFEIRGGACETLVLSVE